MCPNTYILPLLVHPATCTRVGCHEIADGMEVTYSACDSVSFGAGAETGTPGPEVEKGEDEEEEGEAADFRFELFEEEEAAAAAEEEEEEAAAAAARPPFVAVGRVNTSMARSISPAHNKKKQHTGKLSADSLAASRPRSFLLTHHSASDGVCTDRWRVPHRTEKRVHGRW